MNDDIIIFIMLICIIVMSIIIVYQQFVFHTGIPKKLKHISEELKHILENDSDEKIFTFTDNKILMELCAQINGLLENRQKLKVEYSRSIISSKKMLSNISHDIKTPMTVILGYLEMMRLNDFGENEMVLKIEQKAHRVIELINQFFTLAKLEAGDTDIIISKIPINENCRENVLQFYELLTEKGFEVEISVPERVLYVLGNGDALERIMFNLISNVIRYGFDGKYLGIFLRSDMDFVYIDVIDKGKGIEKSFVKSVFERLYTMEDSRNREIQGNGLGLTIAKSLAAKMGGDIILESLPFVKTVFTIKMKRVVD